MSCLNRSAPEFWDYDRFGTPNYYEMELEKNTKA
jgi:hypothetical protein